MGVGAPLDLFCDVVFMSETARIGDPHVRVGLVAGDGGAVIWPLLIGVARAKQYLMTGDTIDGKEAERIGLVNKALPTEEGRPYHLAGHGVPLDADGGPRRGGERLRREAGAAVRGEVAPGPQARSP